MSLTPVVPKHLFDSEGQPLNKNYFNQPIGSGPYQVESFSSQSISLKKNPNYFRGSPQIEKIQFQAYENEKPLLQDLIKGSIDIHPFLDYKYLSILKNIPHLKTQNLKNQDLLAIFFNTNHPLFKSKKVRQALNYAINKKRLLTEGIQGNGNIANSIISPSNAYHTKLSHQYTYQPNKALELLKEEGWSKNGKTNRLEKNGKSFRFTILLLEGTNFLQKAYKIILSDFLHIGIQTEIQSISVSEFSQKIFTEKNYEAAIMPYLNYYPVEFDFMFWSSPQNTSYNFTNYNNPAATQTLENARYASSFEEGKQHYADFLKAIHDDPPGIFLIWRNIDFIVNKNIKDLDNSLILFWKSFQKAQFRQTQ